MATWLGSYETLRFDTPNGQLAVTQFADAGGVNPRGGGPFVFVAFADEMKRSGQPVIGCLIATADPRAMIGRTGVTAIGRAWFHDFLSDDGTTLIRVPTTDAALRRLRTIANEPSPTRAG